MCLLVIMCALALITSGLADNVISDKTDSDNRSPADICLQQCVSRCQQPTKTRSCNCISLCEMSCVTPPDPQPAVGRRPRPRRRQYRSPPWREAAIIARSVGMDLGPLEVDGDVSAGEGGQVAPRLVSLVPGENSVAATVSWDSPGLPSGSPWYLVAWDTQGGAVRGNLLVNSTSVSLTLQPDTLYHVQVSCGAGASGTLEVDTHTPRHPLAVTRATLPEGEGLGGVAAAVLLFLVVLVAVRRRRRGSKNIEGRRDCHIFTLYPPPVTLARRSPQLTV